ncbi:MAG: hypothetical protein KA169_13355, partial [Burkholderiaceae bacterium]|nr:hypothetical protein [Burkholderiaceae bacterium]
PGELGCAQAAGVTGSRQAASTMAAVRRTVERRAANPRPAGPADSIRKGPKPEGIRVVWIAGPLLIG